MVQYDCRTDPYQCFDKRRDRVAAMASLVAAATRVGTKVYCVAGYMKMQCTCFS